MTRVTLNNAPDPNQVLKEAKAAELIFKYRLACSPRQLANGIKTPGGGKLSIEVVGGQAVASDTRADEKTRTPGQVGQPVSVLEMDDDGGVILDSDHHPVYRVDAYTEETFARKVATALSRNQQVTRGH